MNKKHFACFMAVLPLLFSPGCPKFAGITLGSAHLVFSPQLIDPSGGASNPQSVTLTSSGNGTLNISSITSSGQFTQTNNCPQSMPPQTSCTLEVTFAPNAAGPISGAVTITSNAISKQIEVVGLSGTGVPPISSQPSSLDFGSISVGTSSSAQMVTLTNNFGTTLTISHVGASGGYTQTNNCTTISAGQSCQINVTFSPKLSGAIVGALSITSDASPDALPIALTGTGLGSATPAVSFSPASLDFGNREAGSISGAKNVAVTNTGNSNLNISNVEISSGYEISTDTCSSASISPGNTCSISVKFNPVANLATVIYPGALTIVDSDPSGAQVIGLAGTAVAPISAAPLAVNFGTVAVSSNGTPLGPPPNQGLTFTNTDSAAQDITVVSSGRFGLSGNSCPQTLAAGANCSASVAFTSAYTGGVNLGAVTVKSSSSGFLHPTTVNLSACATAISFWPPSFNFGMGTLGRSSQPAMLTITNGSGQDLNISALSLAGADSGDFAISNNSCTSPLTSGSTCSLDIIDTPAATGARSAALSLADDGDCSPQQVALTSGPGSGTFTAFLSVIEATAGGEIVSSPAGIDCSSGNCSGKFPAGTKVTLQGLPSSAFQIAWSGDCSGSSACSLTMDSDKEVTATLNRNPELLVTIAGTGAGTVTSNPGGINCSSPVTGDTNCVADFAAGVNVTLTAKAGITSKFDGWSGGGCSGTGTCSFVSTSDQTITANFTSTAPDFAVSSSVLTPSMMAAGKSATSSITVSSTNGFNSSVNLACAVTPSINFAPTCALNPNSLTLTANGSGTAALNVSTTAPSVAHIPSVSRSLFFAFWMLMGAIALFAEPKSSARRVRKFALVLAGGVLLVAVTLESACGGGSTIKPPPHGGTPAGVYTITITGTAGNTSHSATTNLTVE